MRVLGKTGRAFELIGTEPYFVQRQMRWTEIAVWAGKCATCGKTFTVTTPIGCADGKYSRNFETANCEEHRKRRASKKGKEMDAKERFSDDLKCYWRSIEVTGENRIRINLREGNCTDMSGAIKVATALMPDVTRIETYSGPHRDTYYFKGADGNWLANSEPRSEWQRVVYSARA